MIYTVVLGDTPAIISQKMTGNPDATYLIAANPDKPTILIDGVPTFKTLTVGEHLAVPTQWIQAAKQKLSLRKETIRTMTKPIAAGCFPLTCAGGSDVFKESFDCPATYTVCITLKQ
jgi:hypothetical protein